MKSEELLLIAGIGAGIYFLTKAQPVQAEERTGVITPSSMPTSDAFPTVAIDLFTAYQQKEASFSPEEQVKIQETIGRLSSGTADNRELIDLMNTLYSQGVDLPRTSQTINTGVTATVSGQTYTGNIARLGSGDTVFVATQPSTTFQNVQPATTRLSLSEHQAKYNLATR